MKEDSKITQEELDSIRFYMGDPEIVNRMDFKGGPKAYNTINAFLHSGIQNEIDKVREGRILEIENGEHVREYIQLCVNIHSAMEKYQAEKQGMVEANTDEVCCANGVSCANGQKEFITYRVDRESMMQELKGKAFIEGFYSTCKYGFLEEYAHIKENVALIEIRRDETVPYLDFEDLFKGYYAKPEEAEVLIPFGTKIQSLEKAELSEDEKRRYTDINGNPPCGKYVLKLTGKGESVEDVCKIQKVDMEVLLKEVTSEENVKRVQWCLKELMDTQSLTEEDLAFYSGWKERYHCVVERLMKL